MALTHLRLYGFLISKDGNIYVDGSVQNIPENGVEYTTLTGVEGYKFYEEGIQQRWNRK